MKLHLNFHLPLWFFSTLSVLDNLQIKKKSLKSKGKNKLNSNFIISGTHSRSQYALTKKVGQCHGWKGRKQGSGFITLKVSFQDLISLVPVFIISLDPTWVQKWINASLLNILPMKNYTKARRKVEEKGVHAKYKIHKTVS